MPGSSPAFFIIKSILMQQTQTSPTNAPGYFKRYTDQVNETDLFTALEKQDPVIKEIVGGISEEKAGHAYAPGKWTIKELLLHMSDTERIFCYRAMCFARGEKIALPGFDENDYAENSFAAERSWASLLEEFELVRRHTKLLFKSFNKAAMATVGTAGTNSLSVETTGFIIAGHFNHHIKILQERYL